MKNVALTTKETHNSSQDESSQEEEEDEHLPRLKRRRVELMLQELESIRAGTAVFSPLFCCTCPSLPNDSLVSPIVATPSQCVQPATAEDNSPSVCNKDKEEAEELAMGRPLPCWAQMRATMTRPESEPVLSSTPVPIPQTPASAPVSPFCELLPQAPQALGCRAPPAATTSHEKHHEAL